MNKVILQGRLIADPEIRKTKTDKTVATFTLAVNRPFQKDTTDFIRCQAWGKTAETIGQYFAKGNGILVEGSWETGSYPDKDGKTVYTNTCIVSSFDFPIQNAKPAPAQQTAPTTARPQNQNPYQPF